MNTIQRIAKNTGVLLISQMASYILGFFFVMYTARYLGAEGFGVLSFALSFTGIFVVLSDLGLSTLTIREVARNKSLADKYLGNITLIKVILVVITLGLIALFINLLGYPGETIKVVYLIAFSVIFDAFSTIFYSIFQAFEKMEYQSLGNILSSTLMLSGALFAISRGLSIIGFAYIYFIVSAVCLGYYFVVCTWKFSKLKIEFDWTFWKSTIMLALPFGLSAFFSIIAFRIDIVLLSIMKGEATVGWYSAAYGLMEALIIIPSVLVRSILPVLSIYYVSSQESLKIAYQKSFYYLCVLSFPISVGTMILAEKIIFIIYKSGFNHSIIALQILIWTIPIIFLTYMFGTMLASINRQDLLVKIYLIYMFLNVIINLFLIPRYSYVGTSIATIVTELLSFILCYHFLSKFIYKIPIYKSIVKPVIASVIMGLFIIYFINLNFILLVCISIILYFGMMILLQAFSKEDLYIFKQIIKIKREI